MQKKIVLTASLGLLVFLLIGCKDLGPTYVIDEKFRGKWETQSINANGRLYNFPVMIDGVRVDTRGWLIEARTINQYHNGTIVQTVDDVYTDGGGRFLKIFDDTYSFFEIDANGNADRIYDRNISDNVKKTNRFSWE